MTKSLRVTMFAIVVLLLPQAFALANHDTYFEFTGEVFGTSCTLGDSSGYGFRYGIEEGDTSSHIWTLENPRTGTSTGPSMVILMDSGHFDLVENGGVAVPAGTQPGDTLIVTVVATSNLGPDDSDSLAYDCSTGEAVDGDDDDDDGDGAGIPFNPGDARLNYEDAGASYSVYCNEDNSVTVVAIPKNGTPFVSFVATLAEIETAGANPSPAAAIDSGLSGSGGTITLYRRPDGFFQLSGPSHDPAKGYFVDFDACPATTVNTWEA